MVVAWQFEKSFLVCLCSLNIVFFLYSLSSEDVSFLGHNFYTVHLYQVRLTISIPLLYTVYSWNNMCIFYLFGHIWVCLFGFYSISTFVDYLMPNPFLYKNNCISNNWVYYTKTVLFQAIQFSVNMQFSSVWPIDWTQLGATTLGLSGPGSDGNEGVLHIFGISPSDCLVSYPGQSSYPSAELQLVYSTTTANWANIFVCS